MNANIVKMQIMCKKFANFIEQKYQNSKKSVFVISINFQLFVTVNNYVPPI